MCDYSLQTVRSRPARVSDKLVSSAFRNTCTHGFAPVGEPEVAVCLLPGTELAFENEVTYDRFLGFFPRRTGACVARFRQVNMDNPEVYHHALEFPDGRVILVHQLTAGQRATVLQLPSLANPADVGEHRTTSSNPEPVVARRS